MGIKQEINLVPDLPSKPHKSHRGLWITIIALLATATIGIAITTIIINIPRSIEERAEDAATNIINNIVSSDTLSAKANYTFTPKYIEGVTPTFTGEIALNNNQIFAKVTNLNDLFTNQYHDQIIGYLKTRISSGYNAIIAEKCTEENANRYQFECLEQTNEAVKASHENQLNSLTNMTYAQLTMTMGALNDKWFTFTASDTQATGLFPVLDESELEQFPTAMSCLIPSLRKDDSKTSLIELYKQYPFIAFSEANDNYHYLDLDFTNAANVIKAMPETAFGKNFTACSNISLNNTEKAKFLSRRLESESRYYPDILIRLDDSNSYLTNLRLLADNDKYSVDITSTINYDNNDAIEEPVVLSEYINKISEIINNSTATYTNLLTPPEITPEPIPEPTPTPEPTPETPEAE